MSKWSDFWKSLSSKIESASSSFWSVMRSPFDNLLKSWTGSGLNAAQTEANAFTSEEAEKERAWSEQMRATNYQASVADMRAAGLNPALMYGSGAGAGSAPSGASASSVAPSGPSTLSELIEMIMAKAQLSKIKAETSNIQSLTEVNKVEKDKIVADTAKVGAETDLVRLQSKYYPRLTDAQIGKLDAEINKITAEIPYLQALTGEADAKASLARAQRLLTNTEYRYADQRFQAEIKRTIADADLKGIEKLIADYRLTYMDVYKTDVPASGWATLGSWFLSLAADQAKDTVENYKYWIDLFTKALKNSLPEVKVENNVDVPVNVNGSASNGGLSLPAQR